MTTLDLSRWQFGITTVFHFIFVPLTIGLALFLAIMQTTAHRTGDQKWERATLFWRRLFLINFAIGVVTGIVQEFQFGMNWSVYSRYVGSVFGAPLAIEGLLAFFLESTFLGIWIFGRGRVSARIHLASIWLVALGTTLSAFFILAANAWMQHPVGYKVTGNRAVMTNFWAVVTNSTLIGSFLHVFSAAVLTAAMLILGVSAWHLLRHPAPAPDPAPVGAGAPAREASGTDAAETGAAGTGAAGTDAAGADAAGADAAGATAAVFAASAKLALILGTLAVLATMFFGDSQAKLMETQQPMKMAAAEAIYTTQAGASFSLLTIGNLSGDPVFQIRVPHLLSVLATNTWNGTVQGINQVQAAERSAYGPGTYKPILWVTYWTFRIMVGCGILMLLIMAAGLWLMRKRSLERTRWFLWLGVGGIVLPFLANATGWIFTEMGRQPWVVYGLLKTSQAVSRVGTGYVVTSLVGFLAIYSLLAAIDFGLMARFSRRLPWTGDGGEPGEEEHHGADGEHGGADGGPGPVPSLIY